jgi:glycosyltransferase involved in cell wall biosynthesis
MSHAIEETEILCYLTNFPTPRMQKKIKVAARCGKVTLIYWKRSDVAFKSGLPDSVLEIPVPAKFSNNRGLFRIVAFILFAFKSWFLLSRANRAKKVYVNYLDVLLIVAMKFRAKDMVFIYAVGDLASVQYGGNPIITGAVKFLEAILMKRVSVLILSSPFFWTEYYEHIYRGRWELIENMPERKLWDNFHAKQNKTPSVVGYIGWIRDRRPIECLIQAVRQLRDDGHDIRIFFAGFGPDDKQIRKITKDFDFVSFHGHYQYDKDAPGLYGKVDIIFSVYDLAVKNARILLPNRFYECAICGLPIIVARHTKLEAYMNQYGTGYSVEFLSVEDIKKALLSHIENDEKSLQIKKALDSLDKSKFFYDRYYPLLNEIFEIGRQAVTVRTG